MYKLFIPLMSARLFHSSDLDGLQEGLSRVETPKAQPLARATVLPLRTAAPPNERPWA
jgi:hypothetical protein